MSSANDLGESLWSLIYSANNSNGLFRCSGSLSLVWKIICVCLMVTCLMVTLVVKPMLISHQAT